MKFRIFSRSCLHKIKIFGFNLDHLRIQKSVISPILEIVKGR